MAAHQFAGLAGHRKSAGQVDVQDFAKLLDAGVEKRNVAADTGRIDQAADRAKTILATFETGDHAGLVGDVHDDVFRGVGA